MSGRRLPNQVIVWRPEVLAGTGSVQSNEWGAANCLASTRPGDRAVIYQSGGDAGVVALFDFATSALPQSGPRLHRVGPLGATCGPRPPARPASRPGARRCVPPHSNEAAARARTR